MAKQERERHLVKKTVSQIDRGRRVYIKTMVEQLPSSADGLEKGLTPQGERVAEHPRREIVQTKRIY